MVLAPQYGFDVPGGDAVSVNKSIFPRCAIAPSIIYPHQHMLFLPADKRIHELHGIVGDSRASPAFGSAVRVNIRLGNRFPGMEYDLPYHSIVVGAFQSRQVILHMQAPGAVGPGINLVFTKRRAMTPIQVAELRLVLRPNTRPRTFAATMTDKPGDQDIVFAHIPNHKALNARWQAHVDQDAVLGIIALLPAERQGLLSLLPGADGIAIRHACHDS